jgi:hypothetical protein
MVVALLTLDTVSFFRQMVTSRVYSQLRGLRLGLRGATAPAENARFTAAATTSSSGTSSSRPRSYGGRGFSGAGSAWLRAPAFPLPSQVDYAARVPTPFSRARSCREAGAVGGGPFGGGDPCSLSPARVLPLGEGSSSGSTGLRGAGVAAQRLAFSAACNSLHPYSGNMTLPPLLDRAALVEHGALLNTAIVRWAAELGLPPPQHHESLGYTGPFIEDHFRERFFLPLRHALTLEQAQLRERSVLLQLFNGSSSGNVSGTAGAGGSRLGALPLPASMSWSSLKALGLGTRLVFETCPPEPQGGRAGCREEFYGATSELPSKALEALAAPAQPQQQQRQRAASAQLYLETPYDSELFYPWVPLFVPWESTSMLEQLVRKSMSFGPQRNFTSALQAHKASLAAWEAAQERQRNSSTSSGASADKPPRMSLQRPVAPTQHPYARAFELFPHVHSLALASVVPRLLTLLNTLMRPDVYYVTVTQRPEGPWLESFSPPIIRALLARTTVLSSGGGGHVPLPLLARVLPLLPVAAPGTGTGKGTAPTPPSGALALAGAQQALAVAAPGDSEGALSAALQARFSIPPPPNATHALSFYGSPTNGAARSGAIAAARAALGPGRFTSNKTTSNHPMAWVRNFTDTVLVLAPRGVGSTSFRLYEALQVGLPPVYVFDGLYPWLPYAHPATLPQGSLPQGVRVNRAQFLDYPAALPAPPPGASIWEGIGHVLFAGNLSAALGRLPELGGDAAARDAAWWAKRNAIEGVRESYFTYGGVLRHIRQWLEDPYASETRLFCAHAVPPDWGRFGLALPPAKRNATTFTSRAAAFRSGVYKSSKGDDTLEVSFSSTFPFALFRGEKLLLDVRGTSFSFEWPEGGGLARATFRSGEARGTLVESGALKTVWTLQERAPI